MTEHEAKKAIRDQLLTNAALVAIVEQKIIFGRSTVPAPYISFFDLDGDENMTLDTLGGLTDMSLQGYIVTEKVSTASLIYTEVRRTLLGYQSGDIQAIIISPQVNYFIPQGDQHTKRFTLDVSFTQ